MLCVLVNGGCCRLLCFVCDCCCCACVCVLLFDVVCRLFDVCFAPLLALLSGIVVVGYLLLLFVVDFVFVGGIVWRCLALLGFA